MNLFGMKKHRIRSLWLLLLLLTCSVTVWAQGSSVTGRVSDEKGELLIGVSVQEKGTTNGTITDMNGQYTLKLSTGNPILLISYIGYKPQEVKVAKQKIVDVVLVEDVSSLDEVVVVGYGNQRKVSVVGAQSTMDVKDIRCLLQVCLLLFPDALPGWLPFSVAANPVTMNRISGFVVYLPCSDRVPVPLCSLMG